MSVAWVSGLVRLPGVVAVAADFSDARHARMIYLAAAGLVVLGIGLTVATVVWWRSSRSEHPVLAPLEVMSDRAWARATDAERRRVVEAVRPPGAAPLVVREVRSEPAVDLDALERAAPAAFDDLAEVALVSDRQPDIAAPAVARSAEPAHSSPSAAPEPVAAEPVAAQPAAAQPVAPQIEPQIEPQSQPSPLPERAVAAEEARDAPPAHVDPLLRSWTRQ